MKLYDYWRSSASYRVRIALNLKGIGFDSLPVNILPGADEQLKEPYCVLNPQMRVPAIALDDRMATQSMAILEWLEETHPEPPLLPQDPWTRMEVRAFADTIACDIHPLNNLSVLAKLKADFGADKDAIGGWYRSWIVTGFTALETIALKHQGADFLFGDHPTLAEICLVPQMANARRFETDLTPFPILAEVDAVCREIPAFKDAAPESVKPG
ncbi:maleylacetoacetate isomerase [Henriciella sp.]|uniref:maleylacetoacetate isomerase n=1 Tax=Henriciella sp. TaxID=1968823 RepID=UPI003C70F74C